MVAPEIPHVRLIDGQVYVERVPNAWVLVCSRETYDKLSDPGRVALIAWAVLRGPEICVI